MTVDSPTPSPRSQPAPRDVRKQLEHILGHRDFEASARTREFLRFVVEEALAGRASHLKGYSIAVEVFGRPPDFDANLDPIVRIQAGRLRRALEHYYLVAGGQDPIVIGMPRGGYAPVFTVNGRPAEAPASHADSPFDSAAALPRGAAVAVLPLRELADDVASRSFAEGLREEFCQELSRYQDLAVIPARRDSLATDGTSDPAAVSGALGARFLLDGSVRRGQDQVKVSAWLVDGPSGRQIWSESFTCQLNPGDIIEAQEEIARSVAAVIGSELGVISQRVAEEARLAPPANLTSYEALLLFYGSQVTLDPDASRQALAAVQAAVAREPDYGPLWAALSNLLHGAYLLGAPGDDPRELAAEYARRGAALAPRSQLARGTLARSHFLRGEREAFLREMEVALHLNPNSPYIVGAAGYSLILADDSARGRPLLERAIAMNPCHPGWFNHALCIDDYMKGNYDVAVQHTMKPGFDVPLWGPLLRAVVLGRLGRSTAAGRAAAEVLAVAPDFEERARDLVHRPILSDTIVEALLDGLDRAGLDAKDA